MLRPDAGTAYVAVDRHQIDDFRPYIYKTSDYGKSWTKLNNGIPEGSFVRAVREDPEQARTALCGHRDRYLCLVQRRSELAATQLNLPTTPVHDLVIKNNDLVVATHGRGFWILDDVSAAPVQ